MGLGGTGAVSDPVATLIDQVNRFGPGAPSGYQYIASAYPLATGTVPVNVAVTAAMILLRRAQDNAVRYGDAASNAMLAKAAAAQSKPQVYVQQNLASVTSEIRQYADSIGAPGAGGFSSMRLLGVPVSTLAIAAGGVLALAYVARGRKRRS